MTCWLDVGPLARMVAAKGVCPVQSMDDAMRRAWYRALRSGRISDIHADRIAVRVCGLTLDEIYGFDYDRQVAS